jgi:hypothetical protein
VLLLGEALVELHRQGILLRLRRTQLRETTKCGADGSDAECAEDIAPGNIAVGEERHVSEFPAWLNVHGESGDFYELFFSARGLASFFQPACHQWQALARNA